MEAVDLQRLAPSQYDRVTPEPSEEIGRVDFAGSFAQPEQAVEFAREIGADRVLLNIEYEQTLPRTTQYARAAFGIHAGFGNRVGTCRRHRFGRCRCNSWDYYSYNPAFDAETIPVSIYRHRAIFLRQDEP